MTPRLHLLLALLLAYFTYNSATDLEEVRCPPRIETKTNNNDSANDFHQDLDNLFHYYWIGTDFESRPIFVLALGTFDFSSVVEDSEKVKEYEKIEDELFSCLDKFGQNATVEVNGEKIHVDEYVQIVDMNGLKFEQISTAKRIKMLLKFWKNYKHYSSKFVSYGFFINVNSVADSLIQILKSLASSAMSRMEIYGTRRQSWVPSLLRKIPSHQLPVRYGGTKCLEVERGCF